MIFYFRLLILAPKLIWGRRKIRLVLKVPVFPLSCLMLFLVVGISQKLIIVNRKLEWDEKGVLKEGPSSEEDVEVREIWQPWLKRQCDFVVRYIVPNRANIIEIMEGQGRFRSEVGVVTVHINTHFIRKRHALT